MKVQSLFYDKTLILNLSEKVTDSELTAIYTSIEKNSQKFSHIIWFFDKAQLDSSLTTAIEKIKKDLTALKIKTLTVGTDYSKSDFKDLVTALDSLKSNNCDRMIKIFAKQKEIQDLKTTIEAIDQEYVKLAAELKIENPPPQTEIDHFIMVAIETEATYLKNLYKTLEKQIAKLLDEKKSTTESLASNFKSSQEKDEIIEKVNKAKNQLLQALKESAK